MSNPNAEKKAGPRKESIMELAKMMDSVVRVKVLGGREFVGTLRGYDDLVNLVLDEGIEYMRGMFVNWLVSRRNPYPFAHTILLLPTFVLLPHH